MSNPNSSASPPSSASRSRTPCQRPPPTPQQPIPAPYICPISSLLMFNPAITAPGHSLDHPCLQACKDLEFIPTHLDPPPTFPSPSTSSSASSSSSEPLVSNVNLGSAIRDWCHTYGHPFPVPIQPEQALHIVRGLKSMSNPPAPPPPLPYSFSPDRELFILKKLQESDNPLFQEYGLKWLFDTPLCSPRILATLISLLTSTDPNLQSPSNQLIYILSQDASNRIHIFRSGAVPPLITVLDRGLRRSWAAAAGTLCNLAQEDPYCRLVIGGVGGIEPLLDRFRGDSRTQVARMESGLALYHLLLDCQVNREFLVEIEGVRRLMEVAGDETSPRILRKQAVILVNCLVGVERGREEVMEIEILGNLLMLVKVVGEGVSLQSLNVMYNVCRSNLREFRQVAWALGGEVVLAEEMEDWGEDGKEMASGMLKVIRGEFTKREQLKLIDISM